MRASAESTAGTRRRVPSSKLQSPLEIYLREINEVPLLTAAEEKMLARAILSERSDTQSRVQGVLHILAEEDGNKDKNDMVNSLASMVLESTGREVAPHHAENVYRARLTMQVLADTQRSAYMRFSESTNKNPDDAFLEELQSFSDVENLRCLENMLTTTSDDVEMLESTGKVLSVIRAAHDQLGTGEEVSRGESDTPPMDGLSPKDRLTRANLRLVVNIARSYSGRGMSLQDLIEEGNLGLLRAVEGFDPSMSTRFSTYASYWIKQSMKRAMINQVKTVRIPAYMVELLNKWHRASAALQDTLGRATTHEEVATAMNLPKKKLVIIKKALLVFKNAEGSEPGEPDMLENLYAGNGSSPSDTIEEQENLKDMLETLDKIDPRQATVLRLRFGIDGEEEKTLKEIGEALGLTRERVRQIESEGLAELAGRMNVKPALPRTPSPTTRMNLSQMDPTKYEVPKEETRDFTVQGITVAMDKRAAERWINKLGDLDSERTTHRQQVVLTKFLADEKQTMPESVVSQIVEKKEGVRSALVNWVNAWSKDAITKAEAEALAKKTPTMLDPTGTYGRLNTPRMQDAFKMRQATVPSPKSAVNENGAPKPGEILQFTNGQKGHAVAKREELIEETDEQEGAHGNLIVSIGKVLLREKGNARFLKTAEELKTLFPRKKVLEALEHNYVTLTTEAQEDSPSGLILAILELSTQQHALYEQIGRARTMDKMPMLRTLLALTRHAERSLLPLAKELGSSSEGKTLKNAERDIAIEREITEAKAAMSKATEFPVQDLLDGTVPAPGPNGFYSMREDGYFMIYGTVNAWMGRLLSDGRDIEKDMLEKALQDAHSVVALTGAGPKPCYSEEAVLRAVEQAEEEEGQTH